MHKLRALIPLLGFLILAGLMAFGLTRDPSKIPTEMLDRPFPDFQMSSLFDEHDIISDQDLKGHVTLVNVFGSWCVACVQEHPKLMALSEDGVNIVGINWRDKRDKGQAWLERYGNPYTQVIFDNTSQLAIDLGITGAPESFIVDQNGLIRHKHVGIITDAVWDNDLSPIITTLQQQP